jgi:hypothetical protein
VTFKELGKIIAEKKKNRKRIQALQSKPLLGR